MKKRYHFTADVTEARGTQAYYVDAETEDEARAIVEAGDGTFEYEELEVQDLGPFELTDVEDLPDENAR